MNDVVHNYVATQQRLFDNNDALGTVRRSAIDQFERLGFPTRKQENWKYTDVRKLAKQPFQRAEHAPQISDEKIAGLGLDLPECHRLVFINGIYSAVHSNLLAPEHEALLISDLASAMATHESLILQYINQMTNTEASSFTALNTAFLQQGSLIHLPASLDLSAPVHLLYISTQSAEPVSNQVRNLIVSEKNSQATIIESYIGLDDATYFTNAVTDVHMQANSQLTHYRIQQESMNSFHLGHTRVNQLADSRYISNAISLGGELARTDLDCRLQAKGATTVLNGLYMVRQNQHSDQHIRIDHQVEHTQSKQNYRGILDDKGRAVFNGKVIVHKGADKTDAEQSNANLLLSNDAEIDTKPELEIYADDVKCSHGATVGQLDDNMLFYLRSRGIDRKTARSLLTFAFAEEVIREIKLKPIRDRLEYLVLGRLPDADVIREFTHE